MFARSAAVVLVVVAGLLLGALTSVAPGGLLPGVPASFANTAGGWTVLTASVVWFARQGTGLSALLGAASFVALVLGHTFAADLRGLTYDPLVLVVVGVLAGPFVGVAAAWLRRPGSRRMLGGALLSGVAIGDCAYGLTVLAATTSPVYWRLVGLLGVALSGATLVRSPSRVFLGVVGTLVVAGALLTVYAALDLTAGA